MHLIEVHTTRFGMLLIQTNLTIKKTGSLDLLEIITMYFYDVSIQVVLFDQNLD